MHANPFRRRNLIPRGSLLMALLVVSTGFAGKAIAQNPPPTPQKSPTVEMPTNPVDRGVGRTNLECVGYFRMPPLTGVPQIVGGEQEQEKRVYATGDIVYIDAGSQQGVREGQEFHVVRPRGNVEKVYRQKKGNLGVFFQEVGQIRVVRLKPDVSIAQVVFACETILLGDLLTGPADRPSPDPSIEESLDRFSDSNELPIGRIMMARDNREMLASGDIVYIDIGAEDNAVLGDFVTIYRKVGTGNIVDVKREELARRSDAGYASDKYRGGTFSQQAQRSKDIRDDKGMYRHSPIKTTEIKDNRPEMPRKVVGEAMIVNIQQRTATAIIIRTAQEVHTGDYVQLKSNPK
jgi:hypothetical protein